jgi:hypothetical protein
MELFKRILDHSATNEQYELEIVIRGSKEELQNLQKKVFE